MSELEVLRDAVARVRSLHKPDPYDVRGEYCTCEEEWPCDTIAALDGAPEPEWEYRVMLKNGEELARGTLEEVHQFKTIDVERRRKAGPWLPVEGESK